MKPLISVIVPVFNGQDYLENCIETILNQTYSNIEIIIINDGSTDGTSKICDRIKRNKCLCSNDIFRSVFVYDQDNKGVSAARNKGINVATGDYISFVDADDRLLPNLFEYLYENMLTFKSDVSGCGFIQWSDNQWEAIEQEHMKKISGKYKSSIYSCTEFKKHILDGNCRCWSKLFKKSCFDKYSIRFNEALAIGEDMLLLTNLTQTGISFCESEYQGYGYYQNALGAMNNTFSSTTMDQIYCWEMARDILGASDKIDSIIIMSVLLTVGRIALLEKKTRMIYKSEIKIAVETLKKYYSKDTKRLLDRGYKIKAAIFNLSPTLYMNMYSLWKKR